MENELVQIWRDILVGSAEKSWVLFENGTCVILMKPEEDLMKQALELMKKHGPVYPGSPAGDFSVINLQDYPGWIVTCDHPDILTYVSPSEVEESDRSDLTVGLFGRDKRARDARELRVIHVADNPSTTTKNQQD